MDSAAQIEHESLARPAVGSLFLHGALVAALLLYGLIGSFFHQNQWGNAGSGGAIQVNLVSSALPLPNDQPRNQNVLATETPSQAPAEPAPKEKQAVDETAIPISGKEIKPQQQTTKKTPPLPTPQSNKAQYGEQAGSLMQRATQAQNGSNGPVNVSGGNFGTQWGYYTDDIQRRMGQQWNRTEVSPNTPRGARAYIEFSIDRSGNKSNIKLDQSSGSSSLDSSCLRAAQRVDRFLTLPSGYNQSTVLTSYYCEF
jgi:protein TonB